MLFKYFLLAFASLRCTLAASRIPAGMQRIPHLDGRVIGGTPVTITNFPYQVSLQHYGNHYCGGSIHTAVYIITAAHCVYDTSPSNIRIRAGSALWDSGGQLRQVQWVKIHNRFNPNTLQYDVAIVRLAGVLNFNMNVQPIPLALAIPNTGARAVVTGWGNTDYNNPNYPRRLQAITVNVIRRAICQSRAYNYGLGIRQTMFCATADHGDACQGDSGGPLVSGGKLIGIVSWGYGCAFPRYPGVYANVVAMASWIVANDP